MEASNRAGQKARAAHGSHYSLSYIVGASVRLRRVDRRERMDDLPLPPRRDGAVAQERRQHPLVTEILAPCFEVLGIPAQGLPKLDERGPEAVRVEVRQPCGLEGAPEDRPDR